MLDFVALWVFYVKKAIENYLEEREEYLIALSVLERGETYKPLSEVKKELGLESWVFRNVYQATQETWQDLAENDRWLPW